MERRNETKRQLAHEVLLLLGSLVLLTFICRLWPILLLMILGIFIATLRLLYESLKPEKTVTPLPLLLPESAKEPSEKDVLALAYSVILRRITELVQISYPEAKWVWESTSAQKQIENGEDVFILLNRASGYRRAKVILQNLQVMGIDYQSQEQPDEAATPETHPDTDSEETAEENYELLAFEWVESHIFGLNARCNEAIGDGLDELVLPAGELPGWESWPDICQELIRAGLADAQCIPEGIKINLTQ